VLKLTDTTPQIPTVQWTPDEIRRRVAELGQWFHNLDLGGVQTAPDHFLHDYPASKFKRFSHALPADLTGRSVLDIGCNAGFYSLEMKRRGAERVLGIDYDERYLAQARFAAEVNGVDLEFRKMSVYDVGSLNEIFDVVIFMGVFYHLRHPLLALDVLRETVVGDLLIFQSMQRGTDQVMDVGADYPFEQTDIFEEQSFPLMYFVENRYAHDPTNWWIPNRAAVEAMLRSSGFEIVDHPETEVYICRRSALPDDMPRAVYPVKGGGN
jgi:tRNA (mo5U34)-methyltransferase